MEMPAYKALPLRVLESFQARRGFLRLILFFGGKA